MNADIYPPNTPECIPGELHTFINCSVGLECMTCDLTLSRDKTLSYLKQNLIELEELVHKHKVFINFIEHPDPLFEGSTR